MIKWIKENLEKVLASLFSTIVLVILYRLKDWLLSDVVIKGYYVILIAVLPVVLFFFIRAVIGKINHKFKTGTAVGIIADDRKFIVIRYHFWYPKHVVCKLENKTYAMSVHENYLEPFKGKKDIGILGEFRLNENTHVRTATITKL